MPAKQDKLSTVAIIMNKIVSKEHFSANVVKLEVEAPLIARSRKAGHFVIVKVGKKANVYLLPLPGRIPRKVPLPW